MNLPTKAFRQASTLLLHIHGLIKYIKMNRGIIFCQVDKIKQFIHLIFSITDRNQ